MTPTPRRTEALVATGPTRPPPPSRRGRSHPATPTTKAVADNASKEAQQVAGTAVAQGQQVAKGAARQARQVADTSRQQAAQVAQELSDQAMGLLAETKTQLQDQAQTQIQRLAEALYGLGDQLQALVDGRPQDAPTLLSYLRNAPVELDKIADDLESRGAEGLLEDVQTFARRHPGAFLVGAGVAGLAVGRVLRNAANDARQPAPEELPPAATARVSRRRPADARRR